MGSEWLERGHDRSRMWKWAEMGRIMMDKKKLLQIEKDPTGKERETRRKLKEFSKEQIQKGRKASTRDTHAIIDGRIWKWTELENKPFQTGKAWKRNRGQEGKKKHTDTSTEHSGRENADQ
ncbi:hypothetical protein QAD02_003550 [Eretmocerus hayati]|uniref:Uncharacterized protein n=1 Tax=Eretmocerus hayati TaxID=131215 RepID=A0ACC2NMD9_9HYME|nr:hypothetical protein QAD02_003550 [Eretmocerus hayati]